MEKITKYFTTATIDNCKPINAKFLKKLKKGNPNIQLLKNRNGCCKFSELEYPLLFQADVKGHLGDFAISNKMRIVNKNPNGKIHIYVDFFLSLTA